MKNVGILRKILIAYFVLLAVFLSSLTLSSLIPSALIRQNIGSSLPTLESEGTYPSFGVPWRRIVLDNFTDSLMLNTAYTVDSHRPFRSALVNNRFEGITDNVNQITNLKNGYLHYNVSEVTYERYWHGYLVFLRPLLLFVSYPGIRNILTLLLNAAFIWFIYLCFKKLGIKKTVCFILGFLSVDFFYLGRSLQFSDVFLVGLSAAIYLLRKYQPHQRPFLLFFIVGGLTSFFDLLTAPLVSLGIPLIVISSLNREKLKNILSYCLSWSAGYLLLWYSKWLIVDRLFLPGAIANSFYHVINRTVTRVGPNFSQFNAVRLNLFQLLGHDPVNKAIVVIFGGILLGLWLKYLSFKRVRLENILPWIVIGLIPYAWYVIAASHSYLHVWFTYRNQLQSVVSLFLIMAEFVDWPRLSRDFSSTRLTLSQFVAKYH